MVAGTGLNIPTKVEPLGGARFSVSFTPRTPDLHSVQVTFNDEPVLGSPFECSVSSHEYHAHVAAGSGHVPHISHSHVTHVSHPPVRTGSSHVSPPVINQKSEHRQHHVSQTLQQSHRYIQGNHDYQERVSKTSQGAFQHFQHSS